MKLGSGKHRQRLGRGNSVGQEKNEKVVDKSKKRVEKVEESGFRCLY
jgi:hypothetical protein